MGQFLQTIAERILALPQDRILRIGIDGVDGAGKTTFADELARVLAPSGRPLIRATVDGFHNSKAVRYRLGKDSPEGFFQDSYNYGELKTALLQPLGPGGSRRYRTSVFDHTMDRSVVGEEKTAAPNSILIFDGIFLHRPQLREHWDFSLFLDVGFAVSIPRGAARGPGFGSPNPDAPSNRRYIEGQKLYLESCEPQKHATLVI
ncbi:MAG: uridine kinase, partial [Bdellovibrionota bacterium]